MALTIEQIYKRNLAKFLAERQRTDLTPAQKAKLTKKIKRLSQQLEWAQTD